jgi:hypothetical protein
MACTHSCEQPHLHNPPSVSGQIQVNTGLIWFKHPCPGTEAWTPQPAKMQGKLYIKVCEFPLKKCLTLGLPWCERWRMSRGGNRWPNKNSSRDVRHGKSSQDHLWSLEGSLGGTWWYLHMFFNECVPFPSEIARSQFGQKNRSSMVQLVAWNWGSFQIPVGLKIRQDVYKCLSVPTIYISLHGSQMGMDQYLLIPFLGGWTSIYQLFWCSPGVQGFDTLPHGLVTSKMGALKSSVAL